MLEPEPWSRSFGSARPLMREAFEPSSELQPGQSIRGFQVRELLKQRSVTEVYRAIDMSTGGRVVLKRLRAEADDEERLLFRREVDILLSLAHPRIPRAMPLFEVAGSLMVALEDCAGETFKQRLDRQGPLSRTDVIRMLEDVLEVLVYLHAQDPPILHRDLKPQNLLLGPCGVSVIDFGIAARGVRRKQGMRVSDLTRAHTTGYAPPEQAIGLEAYPQSDLYALAATAAYLWTGDHPISQWEAGSGRIQLCDQLERGLRDLLDWMLAPGLADRCPTAEMALRQLRGLPV